MQPNKLSLNEIIFQKNVKHLLLNLSSNVLCIPDPGFENEKAYIFNANLVIGHAKDDYLMLYKTNIGWEYCVISTRQLFSGEYIQILRES